jgi:hypothetical protein
MKTTVLPRETRDLDALAEVLVSVHAADGYPRSKASTRPTHG